MKKYLIQLEGGGWGLLSYQREGTVVEVVLPGHPVEFGHGTILERRVDKDQEAWMQALARGREKELLDEGSLTTGKRVP